MLGRISRARAALQNGIQFYVKKLEIVAASRGAQTKSTGLKTGHYK